VVERVVDQLHKSVSIYDASGVIKEFETDFKTFVDAKDSYALLCNSGTSAIHSMFYAIGLMPGDEVLMPVYTFHATASPAMQFGIIPIFCDALNDGCFDPYEILRRCTPKTKAVVVTHIWGQPCQMDKICEYAVARNLLVLEDCSHAHGATFKGRFAGTFGDAAAWSLQGQKLITGGEGGIMIFK
jgi:dTDP-4-amino-4,6-dideoxygalactose transaminase